jgi:hypothetical protein
VSASHAAYVYNALLAKLADLSQYSDCTLHFIMEANPNVVGPLISELFDLQTVQTVIQSAQ